jgi:hypothetical protein
VRNCARSSRTSIPHTRLGNQTKQRGPSSAHVHSALVIHIPVLLMSIWRYSERSSIAMEIYEVGDVCLVETIQGRGKKNPRNREYHDRIALQPIIPRSIVICSEQKESAAVRDELGVFFFSFVFFWLRVDTLLLIRMVHSGGRVWYNFLFRTVPAVLVDAGARCMM